MKYFTKFLIVFLYTLSSIAQTPSGESMLGLNSVPTSELGNITNPIRGSILYNPTEKNLYAYDGKNWIPIGNGADDNQKIDSFSLNTTTGELSLSIENDAEADKTILLNTIEPWYGVDDNTGATLNTENIYSMGKVGIGTSTINGKLHIQSSVDAGLTSTEHALTLGNPSGFNLIFDNNEILARNNGAFSNLYIQNESSANTIFNNSGSGRVGIGGVPSQKLDVFGTGRISNSTYLAVNEDGTKNIVKIGNPIGGNNDGYYPISLFGGPLQTGWNSAYMGIDSPNGIFNLYPYSGQGNFTQFKVTFNPSGGNMYIANGNLGIKVSSPTAILDVNGDARIRNLTSSNSSTDMMVVADASGVLKKTERGIAPVKEVTTNYSLTAQDSGFIIYVNSSTNRTITIPSGLPIGFNVSVYQQGTGVVTFNGGSGTTVVNRLGRSKTAGQYAGVGIVQYTNNQFTLTGDLKM
ncbi:hypothetical protein [Tenacibaculum sp. UWU-22]|uniref:hypothetical protein n=1 Tax=Tenacibaculum sp. UWU-22 TaxID=3234187 RepID=UPI0034DB7365